MLTSTDLGFDPSTLARDRAQLRALSYLATHCKARLVLKGDLAMRAVHLSPLLARAVQVDVDSSMDPGQVYGLAMQSLMKAEQDDGLCDAQINRVSRTGEATWRWQLSARTPDRRRVQCLLEFQKGRLARWDEIETVTIFPPAEYEIPSFSIRSYPAFKMVTHKLLSLMQWQEGAPRDLYDLWLLSDDPDADPSYQWSMLTREALNVVRYQAEDAIRGIPYDAAIKGLLPYLPPVDQSLHTAGRWGILKDNVCKKIRRWTTVALQLREMDW